VQEAGRASARKFAFSGHQSHKYKDGLQERSDEGAGEGSPGRSFTSEPEGTVGKRSKKVAAQWKRCERGHKKGG